MEAGAGYAGPQRLTVPMLRVLNALVADPKRDDWFALELSRKTNLGSGTIVQILFRLERWGWLEAHWEDTALAHGNRRPRRRFYKLTALGQSSARQFVEQRFGGLLRWAST